MHVDAMLRSHPAGPAATSDALAACVEACFDYAQTCTACADACLGENQMVDLRSCISLNLDCAALCAATGAIASRRTRSDNDLLRTVLETCAEACRRCAAECARHAGHHDHCRVCPKPVNTAPRPA